MILVASLIAGAWLAWTGPAFDEERERRRNLRDYRATVVR